MTSLWNRVLESLEQRIDKEQIDEYLRPAKILEENEKQIKVLVKNDLFIDWIHENYLDEINRLLAEMGHESCKVRFLQREETPPPPPVAVKTSPAEITKPVEPTLAAKLNQRYKFDCFVVGSSNQFAHAAALAVAEAPSTSYNPLYLYGYSGLGKTHLLHAIGHSLFANRPDLKICYTTCEEFTNQFINSIRFNKGEAFRERYRSVDVLLIDDIQFLSGKTQTQEEFFHTFNTLFEQQKQIILSSDCAPSNIPKLEARLTSRFQWGLIADVQPPALETRIAILKKKAEAERVYLPDDVVLYIAGKVKTNVRELEGALVKLLAYASLGRHKIDLELAEQCLRSIVKEESSQISCDKIKKYVAERFSIQAKDLITKSNSKRIAQPRQIAMYLTRQLTGMSLPEIGLQFGNKHHSTVLYSIQKVEKQMKSDTEYQSTIMGLKKSLS